MTETVYLGWRRVGAWSGGAVYDLAISPHFERDHLVLAATAAGVFRSTDGGKTWQQSSKGLADPYVTAVIFAPVGEFDGLCSGICAFAATNQGRLYTSLDGGQNWTEVAAWAGLGKATALAIPPDLVAPVGSLTLFVATGAGIFRTQDGGKIWESSTFGLHDPDLFCLACAPDFTTSELIWTGGASGGFYRSRNGGRSWRDSGEGLPDDAITCLLISPGFGADQTMFAGTESNGLFRSTDGGRTWSPASADLVQRSVFCLAASSDGRQLVMGTDLGVYVSLDQGQTWLLDAGSPFIATSLVYTATDQVLAGSVDGGVYRSEDGGRNWQQSATGVNAHAPPVVVQSRHGELFALDMLGVLACSHDNGINWHTLVDLPAGNGVTAVAVSGDASTTQLWIAADDGACYRATYSQECKLSWECCITPGEDGLLFHLIAPLMSDHGAMALLLAGDNGLIYRWSETEGVQAIDPSTSWPGETLLHLAVSPADSSRLVAATARPAAGNYQIQLWESHDGGVEWEQLATLQTEVPAVSLAWPVDPEEQAIFLATRHRVIKFYLSNGQLAMSQTFLDGETSITALAASPGFAADHTLYAATNRGVYRSVDAGATWSSYGAELAERTITALFPAAGEGGLLAVELGGVIWLLSKESRARR